MSDYKEPSHEQIHQRGSEGTCPPEGGEMTPSRETEKAMPTVQSPTKDRMWADQIESFGGSAPQDFPNGDNSKPAIGSVELKGQGDQRKYAEQIEMTWPGDMRVKTGGSVSNPTEDMPGA